MHPSNQHLFDVQAQIIREDETAADVWRKALQRAETNEHRAFAVERLEELEAKISARRTFAKEAAQHF